MPPEKRLALACLAIGLVALLLGVLLWLVIIHVKRRYRQGQRAIAELQDQARSMQLDMEEASGKAAGGPRTLDSK